MLTYSTSCLVRLAEYLGLANHFVWLSQVFAVGKYMTFTIENETKNVTDLEIELELEHRMSRFGLNPCGR